MPDFEEIYQTYFADVYRYILALSRDAHTAESEEAFNRAVAVLEEVRDMDRASVCGRRAHQLREELRRARLAAARYD